MAVPVGVPVSEYSPYTYSSSPQQQQQFNAPPKSAEDILLEKLATLVAANLANQNGTVKAAVKPTAFGASCVGCHSKPGSIEAGAPQFTTLDALSTDQRLKAIDAIVNDRMPKGGKLTAEKAGALIRELAVAKPAKASAKDVPPPPPTPEEIGEPQ